MRTVVAFLATLHLTLITTKAFAASDRETADRINNHLTHVERQARSERHWGGGTLIGLGVLSGIGAIALSNSSNESHRQEGAIILGVMGGLFATIGGLVLAFPTDFEELPQEYRKMPDGSGDQLRTKIGAGESYLSNLAQRARSQRITGGATLIAIGVAESILYAATDKASSYLLYQGILFAGLGVVTLLDEKTAESEYREYKDWRGKEKSFSTFQLGFAPAPSGGLLAVTTRF